MSHITIETSGVMGYKTRVWFIDDDGTTTEISGAVQAAEVTINVNDPNKVKLFCILGHSAIEAEVEDVILNTFNKVMGTEPVK